MVAHVELLHQLALVGLAEPSATYSGDGDGGGEGSAVSVLAGCKQDTWGIKINCMPAGRLKPNRLPFSLGVLVFLGFFFSCIFPASVRKE